jgi:hypothetical protein
MNPNEFPTIRVKVSGNIQIHASRYWGGLGFFCDRQHGVFGARLGVTRLGIESLVRRSLGPPSSGISKDGLYGT